MAVRKTPDELVVITRAYDFILWSCNHVSKFPPEPVSNGVDLRINNEFHGSIHPRVGDPQTGGLLDPERFAKSSPRPRFCSPKASKNRGGAVGAGACRCS